MSQSADECGWRQYPPSPRKPIFRVQSKNLDYNAECDVLEQIMAAEEKVFRDQMRKFLLGEVEAAI